jgi:hypothetical protein
MSTNNGNRADAADVLIGHLAGAVLCASVAAGVATPGAAWRRAVCTDTC